MDLRQELIRLASEVPALRADLVPLLRKHATIFPRELHLPKAIEKTPPYIPEGTDLAVWRWDVGGKPAAIMFQGKSNTPLWRYGFTSVEEREEKIEAYAAARRTSLAAKSKAQVDRNNYVHNVKIGDVFYTSWGYDQTNVDFYQVTDVIGKQVVIREIESTTVSDNGPGTHRVGPNKGHFIANKAPMRKLPKGSTGSAYLTIDGHSASLWKEGESVYSTGPYDGH